MKTQTIAPPPIAQTHEAHELAKLFPLLGGLELEEMAESIAKNGQREDIVIYGGKILDGRNTHAACTLAGVEPRFREYNEDIEGPPLEYVLDKNLERRHLTPSQRGAVATAALAMRDGVAGVKVAEVATIAGISRRTATDAIAAAEAGKNGSVATGEQSASAAAKKARESKKKTPAAKQKAQKEEDDGAALRAENEGAMKKAHGVNFARAFGNGSILKTKKELKAFLDLDVPAQKDLTEYLAKGWTVAASVKFHTREITTDDTIESLILRVAASGKDSFDCTVAGHKLTIKRQK